MKLFLFTGYYKEDDGWRTGPSNVYSTMELAERAAEKFLSFCPNWETAEMEERKTCITSDLTLDHGWYEEFWEDGSFDFWEDQFSLGELEQGKKE